MTLAVHPRFGEEVIVLSKYGRCAVCVETNDGTTRLLPLGWTSLQPRREPLVVAGRGVRLDPSPLRLLAAWVAARTPTVKGRESEEVAAGIDVSEKSGDGPTTRRRPVGAEPPAAVVGQAGAPDAARRGERRERGKR